MPRSQILQLPTVNTVVQDYKRFKSKFKRVLKRESSDGNIPNTKALLEEQIKTYRPGYDDLRAQARGTLDEASKSHTEYEGGRATGHRRIGHLAQRFVACFSDFLSAYSGIVEVLRDVGQGYGTVAYETLSIFLVVGYSVHMTPYSVKGTDMNRGELGCGQQIGQRLEDR